MDAHYKDEDFVFVFDISGQNNGPQKFEMVLKELISPPRRRPKKPLIPKCSICMEKLVNTILLPCSHICLCQSCAGQVEDSDNSCPLCRAEIDTVSKVYIAGHE
jgi:hypothetical protein